MKSVHISFDLCKSPIITLKLENMVKEGINKATYILTQDNTIKDLNNFKQFLKRNFKGYDKLDMLPTSNQPARIYTSAKTQIFIC